MQRYFISSMLHIKYVLIYVLYLELQLNESFENIISYLIINYLIKWHLAYMTEDKRKNEAHY